MVPVEVAEDLGVAWRVKKGSLEEWISEYKRTVGEWEVSDSEILWFRPEYGFFTWIVDYEGKRILIPKMIGDGRYMRKLIYDMTVEASGYGVDRVCFCTRSLRHARAYGRILGGKTREEMAFSPVSGKDERLYRIEVSLSETKMKGVVAHEKA
ncbi:MAG: hypothetical protein EOM93_06455 [Gammaproteobacteria bacterium]|nr:hypothetical protein [Gammaproteobacteria bacterium]